MGNGGRVKHHELALSRAERHILLIRGHRVILDVDLAVGDSKRKEDGAESGYLIRKPL